VRDADGWSRIPGFWSPRQTPDRSGAGTASLTALATSLPVWRRTGPPVGHPDDRPGPAPGPDFFYIAGHYAPIGDRLVWNPGFWAQVQPGWDWVPARWVRRPDGWEFRAGNWVRDLATATPPESGNSGFGTDRRAPPPGGGTPRDPIAGAEEAEPPLDPAIVAPVGPPLVVVRPRGMRYYVIRPPGAYPYGPGGVVVPGAVPPFVRRILDQVLP
jgi:hypothetical protein